MQIYTDVTGREIKVASSRQALGAAMFGALAAGNKSEGYDSIEDAVTHMASIEKKTYLPIPENVKIYNRLFAEYQKLHDYFGRGITQVMKRLRRRQI